MLQACPRRWRTIALTFGLLSSLAWNALAQVLAVGQPVTADLSGGETQRYLFALPAEQLLQFKVEQQGIDVVLRVVGPGAQVLATASRANGLGGSEEIEFRSAQPGVYRLEVAAATPVAARGRYVVTLLTRRALETAAAGAATPQTVPQAAASVDTQAFEQLLKEADALRADYAVDGMRKSIEKFQAALTLWRNQKGAAAREAEVLKEIGDTYGALYEETKDQNDRSQTLAFFEQAQQVRGAADRQWEAFIRYETGRVLGRWRELPQAIEAYQGALEVSRSLNDEKEIANTLQAIGEIHIVLGQFEQGVAAYQEALPHWQAAKHIIGESSTLNSLGLAHQRAGNLPQALDYFQQALQIRRALNNPARLATILDNITVVYRDMGELQLVIDTLKEAQALNQQANNQEGLAFSALNIGSFYAQLGQPAQAQPYFEQALEKFKTLRMPLQQAAALNNLGRVFYDLNDKAKALDYHQQALTVFSTANDRVAEISALLNVSKLTGEQGQKARAVELLTQALDKAKQASNPAAQINALNLLGQFNRELGQVERAAEQHRQALTLAEVLTNPRLEVATRANLARAENELGHASEALTQIEAALRLIETLRTKVASQELRTSYFATVQSYYDFYIELLMQLQRRDEQQGYAATALHASERARARSLLELLNEARVDIRAGVDAKLLERERALRLRLNKEVEDQIRLLGGPHTKAQAEQFARKIERTRSEFQEAQTAVRQASPRYAALTQPQPLTVAEIQHKLLDENTLLLEYALGERQSYLWVVGKDSLHSFELPKRAEIETATRRLLTALTARNQTEVGETAAQRRVRLAKADAQVPVVAAALGKLILQPAASLLKQQRLLVVADGALQYVPFSVLTWRRGTAAAPATPLVAKHEIVNLPSASTLAVLRREVSDREPAARSVAVVADPVFEPTDERLKAAAAPAENQAAANAPTNQTAQGSDSTRSLTHALSELRLPRLPFTALEAERILKLAPADASFKAMGFQATRDAALQPDLSQYRYVHFATHGYFNSAQPETSGLVFSRYDENGKPQNGFLLAADVYNLRLAADAVVLSACETGLGAEVRGEGIVGLTRGFMYAGAARVVVSLWSISDQATAELMGNFYRSVLREQAGHSPAAALRAAQLAMWQRQRWRAPYYWAAFTLQGEYR